MLFNSKPSQTNIALLIVLVCGLLFLSCNLLTEPEPIVNKDPNTTPTTTTGSITLRDTKSGQIIYDGQQVTSVGLTMNIVPDSSNNKVIIDGVQVDGIVLATDGYEFYDNYCRIGYTFYIQNNTINIRPNSDYYVIKGQHVVQFTFRMYYVNFGIASLAIKLGQLQLPERIYKITLVFN